MTLQYDKPSSAITGAKPRLYWVAEMVTMHTLLDIKYHNQVVIIHFRYMYISHQQNVAMHM